MHKPSARWRDEDGRLFGLDEHGNVVEFLSLPDPPGTTRIEIITHLLGPGG